MSSSREDLRHRLRLMVITDRELAADRGWLAVVESALQAGATAVQLRDKRATSGELLEMGRALRTAAESHGALLLVDDRFDIALALGAHGVHLGDEDVPIAEVRRIVPRGFVIGRSADTEEAARRAEAEGADYVGVGSVFPTSTKPEVQGEAIGTERLGRVARAVSIPVVAIGGIGPTNAAAVAASGVAGIAVISAIMASADPGLAARELLQAFATGRARSEGRKRGK